MSEKIDNIKVEIIEDKSKEIERTERPHSVIGSVQV